MKKVLVLLALAVALVLCLVSCGHEHSFGEWSTIKAPSCSQDGEQARYCSCGENQTRAIVATDHKWTEATCNAPKTCSGCGKTEGSALEHNWTEATCTIPKTCLNCKTTEGTSKGHNFSDWETTTVPTCKDFGEAVRICGICTFKEISPINPTGIHTPVEDEAVPATCTSTGLTKGSHCSVCEKVLVPQTEEPKIDHEYDDEYDATCNNCTFTRPVACRHSNTDILKAKEPTCTESGLTEGKVCLDCDKILIAQTTREPLEHNWTEATCTTPKTCSRCFDTEGTALDHNWGVATCTTPKTCSRCFDTEGTALEHNWKEATCTEPKTCQRCGETDGVAKDHTPGAEATCTTDQTCTVCGISLIKAKGHNYVDDYCIVCGKKCPYVRDGDYIYFGEYPQTVKADGVTITSTTDERGYYLGSDGSYYAKVTANPYRSEYTFSTGENIIRNNVYYFKVEPIRWRILSEENGEAFLLCDSIIAQKRFNNSSSLNNYAMSDIRAWLNDTFYETVFSSLQQEIILTTKVDNSATSTGFTSNPYACENTNDKIFLLSFAEVTNSAYGFNSNQQVGDSARKMLTSDYSRATGAYMITGTASDGRGVWFLRSPHNESGYVRYVHEGGAARYVRNGYTPNAGVVPALRITL